jgi:hypothetical protein
MASVQPIFDVVVSGTGVVGTETWVDLGAITSGKQVWFGYATFGAVDKNLQFELRYNNTGLSTGTTANTTIVDFSGAQAGSSVDRDFYWYGALATMTGVSTGVEKVWLRVLGQGSSQSGFEYIIRYTVY